MTNWRWILGLVVSLTIGLGQAAAAGDEPALLLVQGKLEVRTVDAEAQEYEYFVRVGKTTYTLAPAGEGLEQLVRKMVAVRGVPASTRKGEVAVDVSKGGVGLQAEREILGTVRQGRASHVVVAGANRTYEVRRSQERKLKPFLGKHVALQGDVVGAGDAAEIVGVRSVERRLLPGEREPGSGPDALRGRWKGTLTATRVPDNVPVEKGVALPLRFDTEDPAADLATGRLMDTYDIVGIELRQHKHRKRTVSFDLVYTFATGGKFVVRMEGTYSEDWKTITGEWAASFLGKGTFAVTFQDAQAAAADAREEAAE